MKRFWVVAKNDKKSNDIKNKILDRLTIAGMLLDEDDPELVISVGGDGTLLYSVHKYLEILNKVVFVAIHTGHLGFLTDYAEDELDECIASIIEDKPISISERPLLKANFDSKEVYAVNEIRIENIMRTQIMDISVDGEFFEKFRGNGVCLCTQAGSSAYNRALNGAVIDSGLTLMQLTEIGGIHDCTHHSIGVPFVLGSERKISFTGDFRNAYLCYDQLNESLEDNRKIDVCLCDRKVRFIRYRKYSYLDRVKQLY